jgi:5'-3' exonuclease
MHKFEEYEKGYKGDRTADDSIPWKEIYQIYDELHEALDENSDIEVFKYRLAEADDIVAVAAKHFSKLGEPVFVVSSDKDFRQLQNTPLVNIYDPIKAMFIPDMGPDGAYEYKLLHIIKGDGGDGIRPIRPSIKNAKSMGDGAAMKVRKELSKILKTEPHVKERFEFNQELIDFAFIPIKLQCMIEKEFETTKFNYNMNGMVQLMKKFRLRKLADRISEFRLPDEKRVTKKNSHFDGRKFEEYSETALNDFFGDS